MTGPANILGDIVAAKTPELARQKELVSLANVQDKITNQTASTEPVGSFVGRRRAVDRRGEEGIAVPRTAASQL